MVTPPNIEHEVEPCLADLRAGVVGKDLGDILPLDPTQRCVSHALGQGARQFAGGRVPAPRQDVSCRRGVGVSGCGQAGASGVEDSGGQILLAGHDEGQLALVHNRVFGSSWVNTDVAAGCHCRAGSGFIVKADLQGPAGHNLAGVVEGEESVGKLLIGARAK